jgi:predicted AAA+ superfamily ATPase
MRRSGKTYFLYQQILKLMSKGIGRSSILYINFEDDRLLPLAHTKLAKLVEAFYSIYPENHEKKCYLFLDEIQHIEDWPLVIRRLHDSKNVEIFLTGSSAKLLSKEIATGLRGRSLSTEIWPYSFDEFLRATGKRIERRLYDKKAQDQLRHAFDHYLSTGGFPEVVSLMSDVRQQVLQEYIDVVAYRDIIERHEISHPAVVKYMIVSMIHNVGRPFAIHKFYNDVKTQGHAIGKDRLYTYAEHIEDAYLAFSLPLYNRSIRRSQTSPKKLYAIDPGIVRALTLDYDSDLGRLFENIVYLDLRRRGAKVSYYITKEGYEVDFVAQMARGQKKLFQVAWDMENKETLKREERALKAGREELNAAGEIITLDSYLEHGLKLP